MIRRLCQTEWPWAHLQQLPFLFGARALRSANAPIVVVLLHSVAEMSWQSASCRDGAKRATRRIVALSARMRCEALGLAVRLRGVGPDPNLGEIAAAIVGHDAPALP